MTKHDPACIPDTEKIDTALRRFIESSLARYHGIPVSVVDLAREPCRFGTLFQVEVLSVSLDTGEVVQLFLKHLGMEQADHPDKQCREREPWIYRNLLDDQDLPVPHYLGGRKNKSSGYYEILLEYIDDWNLKYQGLECWFEAARSLARLHFTFASRITGWRDHPFLLQLDSAYRFNWAQRAIAEVSGMDAALARDLETVVRSYEELDEVIDRWPVTLVHNDLAPKNVIAQRTSLVPRICFVDWEMAGTGCGVMDLMHLCHGLEEEDEQQMAEAYRSELLGTGLVPSNSQEWVRLLAACKLHNNVYRQAHARLWQLDLERIEQWILEARNLLEMATAS